MTNYKRRYFSEAHKKGASKLNKHKAQISHQVSTVSKQSSKQTLICEYPNIFEIFQFLGTLPSPPLVQIPAIPPKDSTKKNTLVLDMDETLIHCVHIFEDDENEDEEPVAPPDSFFVNVQLSQQNVKRVLVKKRPYLDYFLREVSKDWEVVVFTASHPICARPILNTLDPDRSRISYRLYRDACYIASNNLGSHYYIKNLNVLGRDLNSTLLVDNSFEAFGFQLNNGLLIKTWVDDPHDTELLRVLKDLQTIGEHNMTVPEFIQKNYNYSNMMLRTNC
ncbi:CTD small phosphatase-like protein 2 [Lepeophtheirus salmonis]|uniref:CTD small phosphatase-like protein 2 n=1 Tax=Lepeophtheirus salmonis TaxID=72036 RepID=UPI001AE66217|nr:CTD small phosphatase-like protein 2 [Lepeophtheirus salmonis]